MFNHLSISCETSRVKNTRIISYDALCAKFEKNRRLSMIFVRKVPYICRSTLLPLNTEIFSYANTLYADTCVCVFTQRFYGIAAVRLLFKRIGQIVFFFFLFYTPNNVFPYFLRVTNLARRSFLYRETYPRVVQ